ncbi:MAG TPA: cell surface protein [Verrucomicrobiae bacterium]
MVPTIGLLCAITSGIGDTSLIALDHTDVATKLILPTPGQLLVADQLPKRPANSHYISAVVLVLSARTLELLRQLQLPNGSTGVKDICLSPNGNYASMTHVVGNFRRPAIHPGQNWIAANALSIIDITKFELLGSVLLDDRGNGAANPGGMAFSEDGKILVVTHAGTHEISIIDFPALLNSILDLPAPVDPLSRKSRLFSQHEVDFANYVPFFPSPRRRVKLPEGDLGPRSVVVVGRTAFVTNYFSETVTLLDLLDPNVKPQSIPLGTNVAPGKPLTRAETLARMPLAKRGEFYFHDATICFQHWMSCSSCHPDGRADGLNWDLLNDGIGNPKNTKSLLYAHKTPPAMWLGVRDTAETAVRAGLRHILFAKPSEEIAVAIDEYIKSLRPAPSPYLVDGKLSGMAEQGKEVFTKAGCVTCHPPPLFTDLHHYDVGTRAAYDKPADFFDTPDLVELWRTPPYLHDGSAATVRDVITRKNPHDEHGKTSDLSAGEIDDLCAYLLSL